MKIEPYPTSRVLKIRDDYFGDFIVTDSDFTFDGVSGSVEISLVDEYFVGVFSNGEFLEHRFAKNGDCFFGFHFQCNTIPGFRYRPGSAGANVCFSQFDTEAFVPFIFGAFWGRVLGCIGSYCGRDWRGNFSTFFVLGESAFEGRDLFVKSSNFSEDCVERGLVCIGAVGGA